MAALTPADAQGASSTAWTGFPTTVQRPTSRQARNGFYDPQLDAIFIHSAGDRRDDGSVWVYRYRRAGR